MLKLYESFQRVPVMSLRVGGAVGHTLEPIINPNNLFIEGWHVADAQTKQHLILLSQDIRDVIPQGIAINDHEVLSQADDLVRLHDVLELNFSLIGLKVVSESGMNYGKVSDFAFETSSMYVQKIYAGQPIFKNFSGGTVSIDRSQIIEINNKQIIIEDATERAETPMASTSPAS